MFVVRGEGYADPTCFSMLREMGTFRGVKSLARWLVARHRALSQSRDIGMFHLEVSGEYIKLSWERWEGCETLIEGLGL